MSAAGRRLLGLLLALAAAEVGGGPVGTKICATECRNYQSKPVPLHLLKSYKIIPCGAKSPVILETKKMNICANGEETWVKNAMKALDRQSARTKNPPVAGKHFGQDLVTSQVKPQDRPTTPYQVVSRDPNSSSERGLTSSETFSTSSEAFLAKTSLQPEAFANREFISKITEEENFTTVKKFLGHFSETTPITLIGPHEPRTNVNRSAETLPGPSTHGPANSGTAANTSKAPSKLQDRPIPPLTIALGGFLSVAIAIGAFALAKRLLCPRPSAKRVIRGLMYSPCESQAEVFPLDKL